MVQMKKVKVLERIHFKEIERSIEILKLPFVLSAIFIEIFSFIHGIACSRRIEIIQNAFVSHGEHEKFRIAHIEN